MSDKSIGTKPTTWDFFIFSATTPGSYGFE